MRRKTHTAFSAWVAEAGLTCPAVAEQLGVSKGAVYQWANGRSYPTAAHLAALAKLSDGVVTPAMFVGEPAPAEVADDHAAT